MPVREVCKTAARVANVIQKALLSPPGMNLLQCNGQAAKQSVMRFHMHVLPRKLEDGVNLNWELQPGDWASIQPFSERIKIHTASR